MLLTVNVWKLMLYYPWCVFVHAPSLCVQQPCKLFGDTKVTPTYFIVIPGHQQTKQLSRHSIDVNDRNR